MIILSEYFFLSKKRFLSLHRC